MSLYICFIKVKSVTELSALVASLQKELSTYDHKGRKRLIIQKLSSVAIHKAGTYFDTKIERN